MKKQTWEEGFNEKYVEDGKFVGSIGKRIIVPPGVKNFFRQLLTDHDRELMEGLEKKSVAELLEKMGSAYNNLSVQVAYKEGYNHAISVAQEFIKKGKI